MPIRTPPRGFTLQVAQRRCGSGFSRDETSRVARASRVTPTVIADRAPRWRERYRVPPDAGGIRKLLSQRHKDTKKKQIIEGVGPITAHRDGSTATAFRP